ncbi:MAG: phage holin family protein [Patescibacteria group bacterium]|nr:phage holin family protein [Patescibacteria group bacterium]
MKKILRTILFNIVGIYLASQILEGLSYNGVIKVLVLAGIALTLAGFIVKPIIKIITLPINFITLGIFSWLIDVFILYLVTVFVPKFTISSFAFSGFSYNGFSIPFMSFSLFWAFVLCSFVISILVGIFKYICD